jgi:hypothetical protein
MPRALAAAALILWAISSPVAASDAAGTSAGPLQAHINHVLQSETDVPFLSAETDLNGDGQDEVIVHVTSRDYCGSGGCVTLVLQRTGQGYRTVMRASVTRPPIRVLETRHQGWKDIGVMVSGGGAGPAYEAAMAFDGRRYPSNPTTPPARPVKDAPGVTLIAE